MHVYANCTTTVCLFGCLKGKLMVSADKKEKEWSRGGFPGLFIFIIATQNTFEFRKIEDQLQTNIALILNMWLWVSHQTPCKTVY